MEAASIIDQIQSTYKNRLVLTGLAALQYPVVLTHQLSFFDPSGGKKEYLLGTYHVLIRRSSQKKLHTQDHLLFIARHIELYSQELDLLFPILQDLSLKDFEKHDRAWRLFAYLKRRMLQETIPLKKKIGRRYIDLGDIHSSSTCYDHSLHVRDALLLPHYLGKKIWTPKISKPPFRKDLERILVQSRDYFRQKKLRPLFNRFSRYASHLESAASAKIEGYDADVESLKKPQQRVKSNIALQAHLNMDHLHRDLPHLSRKPLSMDLLRTIQETIVKDTWRNASEKIDKSPGQLRNFDEVIVKRGKVDAENVIYIAPRHQELKTLFEELLDFYYQSRGKIYPLDLAAIFKCQLAILHPFGDGNGRLARWCFLYILMQENFIDSPHQAPISHIFLHEKNRYYDELLKVDQAIMKEANYVVDPQSHRYQVDYPNVEIYRNLDYSSWLAYVYDAFSRAMSFSMEEHGIFEKTDVIYRAFEKKFGKIPVQQQLEVKRSIDIGLKQEWGKKTEKRLFNNGLNPSQVKYLKESIITIPAFLNLRS